jgi:protein gp37
MHPDWVRSIRDQCVAAGVPFFFKQWGEWAPMPYVGVPHHFQDGSHAFKVGKKNAGRLLDGREWNEVPR